MAVAQVSWSGKTGQLGLQGLSASANKADGRSELLGIREAKIFAGSIQIVLWVGHASGSFVTLPLRVRPPKSIRVQ